MERTSDPRRTLASPRPVWTAAVAVALLQAFPVQARAEAAVSASVDSDYRFRGLSLSDGHPALSVSVSYDRPEGVFGGVTAIAVETDHSGVQGLGYIGYLGFAHRMDAGGSWEVGVTNSQTSVYLYRRYSANYTEVYAGYSNGNLSAHIFYSPKYIGVEESTLYAEVNGAFRPASHLRVFGHLGALEPLGGRSVSIAGRPRFDLRLGVAGEFRNCEVRLAWTATSPAPFFPEGRQQKSNALIAGVEYFF